MGYYKMNLCVSSMHILPFFFNSFNSNVSRLISKEKLYNFLTQQSVTLTRSEVEKKNSDPLHIITDNIKMHTRDLIYKKSHCFKFKSKMWHNYVIIFITKADRRDMVHSQINYLTSFGKLLTSRELEKYCKRPTCKNQKKKSE